MADPSVMTKTQSVFAPRAATYLKNVSSGPHNLSREFKGIGALLATTVPLGHDVRAWLLPAVGPRSEGHPLRVELLMVGSHDVVVIET